MAHEVKIPSAGESIASASVGQWHKADGDRVRKGEVLVTIETDKVSSELEAEVSGTLHIIVPEGEEVDIGTVVAGIEEVAEVPESSAGAEAPAQGEPEKPAAVSPVAPAAPEPAAGKVLEVKVPAAGESIASATVGQWHKRDGEEVAKGETLVTLETDKVSSELEAEASGKLAVITPEGEEVEIGAVIGTITAGAAAAAPDSPPTEEPGPAPEAPPAPADEAAAKLVRAAAALEAASEEGLPDLKVVPAPEPEAAAPAPDGEDVARVSRSRMSPLRRKVATQLVNVQQTAAILTTFNEADMSAVMRLRKSVQEDFVAKHGVKLGFMSFFVKAVVQALQEVTQINARIDGDEIIQNHFHDIGVAVGTARGLVVPVIRDADRKSFADIERDIIDYATRARDGKIQLEDLRGGCFTISNGGVYGSLLSTPILNPPQSGILGMHTIQERPVAVDGKVEIRPMMYLALSYDHRLVDGKEAVSFLIRVKESVENPTRLLLEL
jgi:2-oxoglutarate dehydrogenase E2 component (dihydrolipoamide succinyltransferase)